MRISILVAMIFIAGCCSSKDKVDYYQQGFIDGWEEGHKFVLDSLNYVEEDKEKH